MTTSIHAGAWQSLGFVGLMILSVAIADDLRASVTISTSDGREIVGEIDVRTTERHLWIRHQDERIVLTTPVEWSSIVAATLNGESVDVAELVELCPQLQSDAPIGFLSQSELGDGSQGDTSSIQFSPNIQANLHFPPAPSRVRAIEIDAVLVNLDRDVEPDGFELLIMAIDGHGQSVAVRGNIYARLLGERNEMRSGKRRFEDLQRWSKPVCDADFENGVASYALRFRTVRPEFDGQLINDAMLNVRLGVTGQGNFEASIPVRIRQFNPFRDELQQYQRSRFFRGELSEEVRRRKVTPTDAVRNTPELLPVSINVH